MNRAAVAALQVLRNAAASCARRTPASAPLVSIFSQLYEREEDRPPPAYLAAHPLRIDDKATLFPTRDRNAAQVQADPQLFASFESAYAALGENGEHSLEQLYYLLQEYAWAVPSQDDVAVSLFDQARTDAALAAASVDNKERVLLVGGDISGIQDFLYTLPAAGATRALRGRSFYLQMLTDAVAHYLLRRAEMPLTNLLYSGGGHFYLVLPANAEQQLEQWRQDLGLFLLRRHNGELYVALGGTPLETAALRDPQRFRECWRSLGEAVSADKRRRFASLSAETLMEHLFTPQGHGGDERSTCAVCRYQGEVGEFKTVQSGEEGSPTPGTQQNLCKLCWSFNFLARDLHNAEYLILTPTAPRIPQRRERAIAYRALSDLGFKISIVQKNIKVESSRFGPTRVLGLKGPIDSALRQQLADPGVVFGFRPLVNETPQLQDDLDDPKLRQWLAAHPDEQLPQWNRTVKTFGILVQQSTGIKRLGVLRMDVDDLGSLFHDKLKQPSLARICALSAALSRFFEGWVGKLCRERNEQHGQRLYAVYSGGDDLFIVGSWELLPDLAKQIHADLAAYALNEDVHLSGGISLHSRKFPLYQAANAAAVELERAKGLEGKNAWGFLGQVVRWGGPADDVFNLYDRLTSYLAPGNGTEQQRERLSRAALQVLQELYSQYAQMPDQRLRNTDAERFFFGPWIWRGVYQLTRMAETSRADREVAAFLIAIRDRLDENAGEPAAEGKRFIERIGLAARWAELYLRKEQR